MTTLEKQILALVLSESFFRLNNIIISVTQLVD